MSKNQENRRNYSCPDSELIVKSGAIMGSFDVDNAKFISYYPLFNSPFRDTWVQQQQACLEIVRDSEIRNAVSLSKVKVDNQLIVCTDIYNKLKFYAEQAFINNPVIMKEFGTDEYKDAHKTTGKMILFTEKLYHTAIKYSNELAAQSFTPDMAEDIKAQAQQLHDLKVELENVKNGRPTLTSDRIDQLNALYKTTDMVCEAGKKIFKNNTARYKCYVFYDNIQPAVLKITLVTNQTPLKPVNLQVIGATGNNITVDFGDGMGNKIIFNNQLQTETHNYSKPWNYDINITGNVDALVKFGMPSSGITTITLPTSGNGELIEISLQDNELTAASINALLQTIDSYGTYNGTIHLTGGSNAAPSGDGITALQKLKERMWTVETN